MQNYKVDTIINGTLKIRLVFNSRTKAQKYILDKYKLYSSKKEIYYVRFVHYSNWGRYKKGFNDMCINQMNVQTKDLNICVELSPV